jgi:hypothetical protein
MSTEEEGWFVVVSPAAGRGYEGEGKFISMGKEALLKSLEVVISKGLRKVHASAQMITQGFGLFTSIWGPSSRCT